MSVSSPVTTAPTHQASARLKWTAALSGLIGFILFVLTPFLPVTQTQSSVSWPQNGEVGSINAPLISYAPDSFSATIPVSALADMPEGQSTVLSTLPKASTLATTRGLFVRYTASGLDVIVCNKVPLELTTKQLAALPPDAKLVISSSAENTTVTIPGAVREDGTPYKGVLKTDERPQITGIYTELDQSNSTTLIDAGLSAHVEINSRFTAHPSLFKYLAMYLGVLMLLVALGSLHMIDRLDGRKTGRFLPAGWFTPNLLDILVVLGLLYWHIFGANTSDDGYLLTMARESQHAGYMANYYRWFGVPESPFGAPYYDLLGLLTHVSTSSLWMRTPELCAGLLTWWILDKEVLPRLGAKINGRRVSHFAAAAAFLAFWMIYNNGLRPEPIIALGALLTWVSIERSIATGRILPYAIGVIIATLSLSGGPTGLMAITALLVGLSHLMRIVYRKLPQLGAGHDSSTLKKLAAACCMLFPFLPAGTAILLAVFGDQTLANVLESIRVRAAKGPSLEWYMEWVRYYTLMLQNPDGSFTRRFPVLMMFVCLALVLASVLKNGRVPGSAPGPSMRLMFVFFGTLFFMSFTPTKWTHHFGVYAGIGAALAALAAVALSHMALQSARNRTFFIGAILFIFAFCLSGTNGWWYISSFGVPWYDKTIQYHHVEASTVMLVISLVVLGAAAIQSFLGDVRKARTESSRKDPAGTTSTDETRAKVSFSGVAAAPIAVITTLVVLFSMACFGKGFLSQYPGYSLGLGNLRTLTGNPCSMASSILAETDTNDSFLKPADGSPLGESLEHAATGKGFSAKRVPGFIPGANSPTPGAVGGTVGATINADNVLDADTTRSGRPRMKAGINGAHLSLPFEIDPDRIPITGSFTLHDQYPARITTTWFALPERTPDRPVLVVTLAGVYKHHDYNNVIHKSDALFTVEYGTRHADGTVTDTGEREPFDVGSSPQWRNVRVPMSDIPAEANVVRLKALDSSLDPQVWLSFTPPRMPKLISLDDLVGHDAPVQLDWTTALQFPCQKPQYHYAGVVEIPEYRVSPDTGAKETHSHWMSYSGGGILALPRAVAESYEIPTYLKDDWHRDWGSLEKYVPRTNSRGDVPKDAIINYQEITRNGLWSPGRMKVDDGGGTELDK